MGPEVLLVVSAVVSYMAVNEDTNRQVTHIEFQTLWACAPTVSLLSSLLNILYLPHTDITYSSLFHVPS